MMTSSIWNLFPIDKFPVPASRIPYFRITLADAQRRVDGPRITRIVSPRAFRIGPFTYSIPGRAIRIPPASNPRAKIIGKFRPNFRRDVQSCEGSRGRGIFLARAFSV